MMKTLSYTIFRKDVAKEVLATYDKEIPDSSSVLKELTSIEKLDTPNLHYLIIRVKDTISTSEAFKLGIMINHAVNEAYNKLGV